MPTLGGGRKAACCCSSRSDCGTVGENCYYEDLLYEDIHKIPVALVHNPTQGGGKLTNLLIENEQDHPNMQNLWAMPMQYQFSYSSNSVYEQIVYVATFLGPPCSCCDYI